jgi:hypothetical protein
MNRLLDLNLLELKLVAMSQERHTPGAEAPHFRWLERAKAKALAYLDAKTTTDALTARLKLRPFKTTTVQGRPKAKASGCLRQRQGRRQIQGFLHCAAHDKTVIGFGRNDVFFAWGEEAYPRVRLKAKALGCLNAGSRLSNTVF